jgi:asparagine synthase (glutamine-hydrolysing)
MCAIVGYVSYLDRSYETENVSKLVQILNHRGPDAADVKGLQNATFGHCLLSILGVDSAGSLQPAHSQSAMLTFNGEIYNFEALANELKKERVATSSESDTSVLFSCLQHWGVEKTLQKIDGMFAFAFFDAKVGALHLVRDRVGEKPVYWAKTQAGLWFASEMKALIEVDGISREPNLERIEDYFYTTKINGSETIFRQINELEPGTHLVFSARDKSVKCFNYWRIEDGLMPSTSKFTPAVIQKFGEELKSAIASRTVSDVPIGVLLSGGIDSNTLLEGILSSTVSSPKELFFADNQEPRFSERADVEIFLEFLQKRFPTSKLNLNRELVTKEDYFDLLTRLTWFYDEPVQFQNSPLLWRLTAQARKKNIKVLLSGEGMDEILFGYDRFVRTRCRLRDETRKEKIIHELYFGGAAQSKADVSELTRGVSEGVISSAPWRWLENNVGRASVEQLQMIFSQKYRLQILLQRQDRVGMASSVEIRVPFLSPSLLSWVNQLPFSAKFKPKTGTTKRVLRDLMATRLPERILTKPKDGFPADMANWIGEQEMSSRIRGYVSDPNGFCQGFLDGNKAVAIVNAHFSGSKKAPMLMWQMLALEIWHRNFSS